MTIGILKLSLFIPLSNSLKEKRFILDSFRHKLRNNFNVSITSLEGKDKWQRADLAVVCVGNDRKMVNQVLDRVVNFTKGFGTLELIDYNLELI